MNPVWHFVNGVPTGGVMAPSLVLVGDGSAAAPSYSFASETDLGMSRPAANQIDFNNATASVFRIDGVTGAITMRADWALNWASSGISTPDVSIGRGAANRLDLATGDSLYLVSGGLGVGVANTTAGTINASVSLGSSAATGTLITQDAQTVAVDAVVSLGTNAVQGFVFVNDMTANIGALYYLLGASNQVREISDPDSGFTVTKDNAGTRNVYWDSGNSRYEFQNKTVTSKSIRIIRLGV